MKFEDLLIEIRLKKVCLDNKKLIEQINYLE